MNIITIFVYPNNDIPNNKKNVYNVVFTTVLIRVNPEL